MAGIKAEMTREMNFSVDTGKLDLAQEWEVFTVADDNVTPNLSGYVDPNTAYTHLPQRGTPHPIFTAALVTGHRLVHIIGAHAVLMHVLYRNYGLYTGGPRAAVTSTGRELPPETVPVIRKILGVVGNPFFPDYYVLIDSFKWTRQNVLRTETRFVGGNQYAAVQSAIARNVGLWYLIDGDFYILSGQSSATYDGYSYTRVNYVFETWARHLGVAANNPLYRNFVTIPPLNSLERWHVTTADDPSQPPVITVIPHTGQSAQGQALPGFP